MAQEIEVKVKVSTEQAVTNVDALGNAFDNTAKDAQDAQKAFAKAGNGVEVEQSIAGLKQLKRELKNVAVGSEEFKKLYNDIDDLEDKLKSAKNTSKDWIDSLEGAGGGLGMLGQSINSVKVATQSFSGALKATGIGLVVSLIAGLTGAFANNEGAMKKIQPLLNGMSKIFQGVFRAVEPLFNTLVDLAINALPMVSKAFGTVYSVLTATLESFGAIGSAIGKLMKGDFSGAWETAKTSVTDFSKHYDTSLKRFSDGTKEMTKNETDEAEKRAKLKQDAQNIQDALDKKSEEKRKKLEEEAKAKADAERKSFENSRDELEKHEKAIADLNKKYDDEKLNREADTAVKKEELDYNRQVAEIEKITTNEIEKQNLIEKLDLEHKERLGIAQQTDDEKAKNDAQKLADELIKIDQAKLKQKQDIQNAEFDLAQGAINFLKEIGGKNKAIQKAIIIAESAIGIARSVIATQTANITATAEGAALAIPTAGASVIAAAGIVTSNNIMMGLGIGTNIAATAKALSSLGGGGSAGSAPSMKGGSGGGGGSSSINLPEAMPVNPNVVSNSGINQLANTLTGVPIKAYVVSKDMTTQQSLDRNITNTATLG